MKFLLLLDAILSVLEIFSKFFGLKLITTSLKVCDVKQTICIHTVIKTYACVQLSISILMLVDLESMYSGVFHFIDSFFQSNLAVIPCTVLLVGAAYSKYILQLI